MAKTWRFVFLWLTAFLIASLAGTACSSTGSDVAPTATAAKNTSSTPAAGGQATPAAAQPGGTVVIGVMAPMSGGSASTGIDTAEGVELAAAQVNEAGGIKVAGKTYKVNVVRYDDAGKPETAVNLARRLRSVDNAPVVIGPIMSSSALAVLEINEKEDFLMVTMAMNPNVTTKGNKLVVRTNTTTVDLGNKVADVVAGKEGFKNWGIVADGGDWGKTWTEAFQAKVPTLGGKISSAEFIDENKQTDFYTQLTNVINKKPDIIGVVAHDAAAAMIVKQARELGWTGPFVFSEGLQAEGRRLAGWDKLGASYMLANATDLQLPNALRYNDQFKAKYNKEGMAYGMLSHAQTMLALRAMEKAGTISDVAKIRAAVPSVYQDVNKEVGTEFINYADSGQMDISQPVVKHVGNGKLDILAK